MVDIINPQRNVTKATMRCEHTVCMRGGGIWRLVMPSVRDNATPTPDTSWRNAELYQQCGKVFFHFLSILARYLYCNPTILVLHIHLRKIHFKKLKMLIQKLYTTLLIIEKNCKKYEYTSRNKSTNTQIWKTAI